jgi:hypothetical protein
MWRSRRSGKSTNSSQHSAVSIQPERQFWLKAKSQEPKAKSHNLQFLDAAIGERNDEEREK